MSEITSTQRLERLNRIRQEHTQTSKTDVHIDNTSHSTFGIRMLIAALLFVGYFFLKTSDKSIGFLNAEAIQTEVNRYSGAEINIFDFMDNFTYTFNND